MRTGRSLNLLFVALTCVVLWAALLCLPRRGMLAAELLPASRAVRGDPGTLFVKLAGSGTTCSRSQPCGLQTALGKAVNGDVIYVAAGVYTGTGTAVVTITHNVTLYGGWDGAASGEIVRQPRTYPSILDGEGARRGLYVNWPLSYTLDGFTIRHGNASNAYDPGRGGGIYSEGATPIIANNIISANVGSDLAGKEGYGGGVYVELTAGSALITGNQVVANVASSLNVGLGGGIMVLSAPGTQVLNNVVLNNTGSITGGSAYGGGIALLYSGGSLVAGNEFQNNLGGGVPYGVSWGGAIFCKNSPGVEISDNDIRDNVAAATHDGRGGGIALYYSDNAVVTGNWVQGNTGSTDPLPSGFGGGIYVAVCKNASVSANHVLSNTAYTAGGGVQLDYGAEVTLTNNIVVGNRASYAGGGLAASASASYPATGTLLHNTFVANNLGLANGRAAVTLSSGHLSLTLTNNLFSGHDYAVDVAAGCTATLTNNLFYANSYGDTRGPGSIVNVGAISGQDPLLDGTYHLGAGSPAIDAGVNAGVTTDIDGGRRPLGAGYDIGADEWAGWRLLYLPVVGKRKT